jgi:hypothetical protein
MDVPRGALDLFWIPLGAGDHVVRRVGALYEAAAAWRSGRPRAPLFHTALIVRIDGTSWVIESAPIRDDRGVDRGVVAEGPVGLRPAGRFRLFRYEIRRWRDGVLADEHEAVGGAVRVAADVARAERVVDLVPSVPTPVWGRDGLHAGEMWNSNSLTAWLLVRAGIDVRTLVPPSGGRAPGWGAGVSVARRPG